ncbi:hypothetical protein [Stetteria hydrogenophila]
MVTAREAFEAKKLIARYGVVGKVAASYRTAGYQVKVENPEPGSDYNFVAERRGERLVVAVYAKSGQVPVEAVVKVANAAKELSGRPVLVLYGAGPRASGELVGKARELGVSLKRFRT